MYKNLRLLIVVCGVVLSVMSATPAQTKEAKIQAQIRQVLEQQVAAWNKGDIEGFMQGYLNSPEVTFSGKTLTRGWQTVFDNYKRKYDSLEKMGTLGFSNLEINVLSKDSAFVLGEWELKRANDNPKGRFTLVFRRTQNGWRIIHDQTS